MCVDYYSGDAGGICNNEDDIIRLKEECSKALSELDFDVSEDYWTSSDANFANMIPSGCSIRDGGNKRPHLLSAAGVGTGKNDLIPICKRNLDSGTTFIFIYFRKRIHINDI